MKLAELRKGKKGGEKGEKRGARITGCCSDSGGMFGRKLLYQKVCMGVRWLLFLLFFSTPDLLSPSYWLIFLLSFGG